MNNTEKSMEILKISSKNQKKVINKVGPLLKKDGFVIACPTDTVYGLICDAENKKAVERIFKIKKRPKGKPVSIFAADLKMAKRFAKIDYKKEEFLKKVWPGAVTVVLKSRKKFSGILFQNKNTIGVRIPKHKFIIDLIKKINTPLAETSANISGLAESTRIKEVLGQFTEQKYQPDIVVDAGNLKPSLPSTVVDLTGKNIKVLRQGPVKIKTKKRILK